MAIIRGILAGIPGGGRPAAVVEPDRAKAIAFALEGAVAGDVIVIAGKGHETTQEIAGVKHPFDDKEMVRGFVPRHDRHE